MDAELAVAADDGEVGVLPGLAQLGDELAEVAQRIEHAVPLLEALEQREAAGLLDVALELLVLAVDVHGVLSAR